jgi:hypothetical protein
VSIQRSLGSSLVLLTALVPLTARAAVPPQCPDLVTDITYISVFRDCIRACPAPCTTERASCVAVCAQHLPFGTFGIEQYIAHPPQPILTPDTAPPRCDLVGSDGSELTATIQDLRAGLSVVFPLLEQDLDADVDVFLPATQDQALIRALKFREECPARVSWAVIDACSNVTICDPVLTTIVRGKGKPVTESYSQLSEHESMITISNGMPGLTRLEVTVNGARFQLKGLDDGERRVLDVSRAMLPGDQNIITLKSSGRPGGYASVLIANGSPQ